VSGVADDVVERADARPGHVPLARVAPAAGAVGEALGQRGAKIPPLAVEVDLPPVDAVLGRGQTPKGGLDVLHVAPRVEVHQVEAEAVHLVVDRPPGEGVDHQLLDHLVFGCGIRAAGIGVEAAVRRIAVVVAGHDLVEHRVIVLPAGRGVVVDHVHHHAQAVAVQAGHHVAELHDARHAVGPGAVGAFDRAVVVGIVAPVEAIPAARCGHRSLLDLRVAGRGLDDRLGPLAGRLDHGRDVERGQQVDVGQARLLQLQQMAHAVGERGVGMRPRTVVGERAVRAAIRLGHGGVLHAEIADVRLVDDDVFRRGEVRLGQRVPALGLEVGRGQVHELAARVAAGRRVRGQVG